MAKRQKSGQAAMEFLMTYGWAILVVLVVIGALAYFGILNPQTFLPKRCLLGSGLSCADAKLTVGEFDMRMVNSLANAISVNAVSIEDSNLQNLLGNCTQTISGTFTLLPGQESGAIASANNEIAIKPAGGTPDPCKIAKLTKGTRIKAALHVVYTDQSTQYQHTQDGEVIADVE